MARLGDLLKAGRVAAVRDYLLSEILPDAVDRVNKDFSPGRLVKLPRTLEPLPTAQRELSSYRTRIGTMLEYALSTAIDNALRDKDAAFRLCFVSYHDYPDFVLRDADYLVVLRIEMKSVESQSDEQAARFDAPTARIDPKRDLVLFVAWEWKETKIEGVDVEYPHIYAQVIVEASDLAKERDRRLSGLRGEIRGEEVLVPSTKQGGKLVPDPGNYGKFWRIVPPERWNAIDLSEPVRLFVEFLRQVDQKALRTRMERRTTKKDRKSGGKQGTLPPT